MTKNESTLKGLFIRSEVLQDKRLSPLEQLAVGYIEYRAAATGEYWEKPDALARFFKVTTRHIATVLEKLTNTGYIVKTEQKRARHIVYEVPRTMNNSSYLVLQTMNNSSDFGKQTMNNSSDYSMNFSSEDYIYNKQEEENNNNAHLTNARKCVDLFGETMQAPEQKPASVFPFAEFWTMYPRKVGKKDAERIFGKLPEKTRALIKERLPEFVKEWQGKETVFIPHPSTWLNGERWLDEAQPRSQAKTLDEVFNSLHG